MLPYSLLSKTLNECSSSQIDDKVWREIERERKKRERNKDKQREKGHHTHSILHINAVKIVLVQFLPGVINLKNGTCWEDFTE